MDFESILLGTLSINNDERSRSEAAVHECKKNPSMFFTGLTTVLAQSAKPAVQQLAAVLLRQNVEGGDPLFFRSEPATQENVRNLLTKVLTEGVSSREVYRQVVNVVGTLGYVCLKKNPPQWTNLLPMVSTLASSSHPMHQEAFFEIIAQLCEYCMDNVRKDIGVDRLKQVLLKFLQESKDKQVLTAALKATISVLLSLEDKELDHMKDVLPLLFRSVQTAVDEEMLQSALESLLEMVQHKTVFFKQVIMDVCNVMIQIATSGNLEMKTRQLAFELLISFVEGAGAVVRRMPEYAQKVIPVAFEFMRRLDLDLDFNKLEDDEEQEEFVTGLTGVERLSAGLMGTHFLSVGWPMVEKLLGSDNFVDRHAALMAISKMPEGCYRVWYNKGAYDKLDQVMQIVLPFCQDSHPRVRFAALTAIGELAESFPESFVERYHEAVFPIYVKLLQDQQNHPRVLRQTGISLVYFVHNGEGEVVLPFLDQLMAPLAGLLSYSGQSVQGTAVLAVGCLAEVVKEEPEHPFLRYYDMFMPGLRNALMQATAVDPETRKLRGQVMQTIGIIGEAVPAEKFYKDAKEIMQVLLTIQKEGVSSEDPMYDYFVQVMARICKAIKDEFLPYLPLVVPPLLHSAKLDAGSMTEVDQETPGAQQGFSEFVISIRGIGPRKIVVNTAQLEEKSLACNMLFEYASTLGAGYMPYVEATFETMIPLMRYPFNPKVRGAALQIMPKLYHCTREALMKQGANPGPVLTKMLDTMWPQLMEAIVAETDVEELQMTLEVLSDCVGTLTDAKTHLSEQRVQEANNVLLEVLKESRQRRQERMANLNPDEVDEETMWQLEAENESEVELVGSVVDCVRNLVKNVGEAYVPHFHSQLAPVFRALLAQDRSDGEHISGLVVFDDIIEYGGQAAQQYVSNFYPFLLNYLPCEHDEVRQAAAYGFGVLAQTCGGSIASEIPNMLQLLLDLVQAPNARNSQYDAATDNAISAIGKILVFQRDVLGDAADQVVFGWTQLLPLEDDEMEARVVHKMMTELLSKHPQAVLGASSENLPFVLRTLAACVRFELADEETITRLSGLIRGLPQQLVQQASQSLTPELLSSLQRAL